MARAHIKPKRRIESLHFIDRRYVAVCDDGTMWKLVESEWVRLPSVPGTERTYSDDCGLPGSEKFPQMPEVEDPRVENFTAEDLGREMARRGWIGVDLDGTLAELTDDTDSRTIGKPVPRMVERVKAWREDGIEVKIVTARVSPYNEKFLDPQEQRKLIARWSLEHIGFVPDIVHGKDIFMIVLWDDLVVPVEKNTGNRLSLDREF